jgi:hypothetical protein
MGANEARQPGRWPLKLAVSCHSQMSDVTASEFRALCESYFDPLCSRLNLSVNAPEIGNGFALASATDGTVRVFFEYERGLSLFALGAHSDSKPLCSVEELAQRFPRIRLVSDGLQRLALVEQSAFVESNWSALQSMFSPEHLPETRKWRQAQVHELTKRFSRGS